ncbi:MAG: hypothetical protein L6V93_19795 [Clostridiales bacterium]|nr:MAG: hypothetical protein L6V93_19795 [Clostridiales bacterium]
MKKLNAYFAERGVAYKNGIASDSNSDNYFSQNPFYLIAKKRRSLPTMQSLCRAVRA